MKLRRFASSKVWKLKNLEVSKRIEFDMKVRQFQSEPPHSLALAGDVTSQIRLLMIRVRLIPYLRPGHSLGKCG